MDAVAKLLQGYRERHELSRTQAAAQVPVSRTTWFRWESGARKIDQDKLPRVVEVTGIPAKELRPDLAELLGGN